MTIIQGNFFVDDINLLYQTITLYWDTQLMISHIGVKVLAIVHLLFAYDEYRSNQ